MVEFIKLPIRAYLYRLSHLIESRCKNISFEHDLRTRRAATANTLVEHLEIMRIRKACGETPVYLLVGLKSDTLLPRTRDRARAPESEVCGISGRMFVCC